MRVLLIAIFAATTPSEYQHLCCCRRPLHNFRDLAHARRSRSRFDRRLSGECVFVDHARVLLQQDIGFFQY